jgi:hypothetical protein
MYWEHPTWLFAWWLVPALAWLLVYARRKRMATAEQFAEPAMLARIARVPSSARSVVKATALLAGLALLIAGAARPRWGMYFETVHPKGVDLFVLLDVSRSMLAEDVSPNRLERAKSDIRDLLTKLVGDRVGLIVFAGAPVVKVPLTNDHSFLQSVLDEVDPTSAPRGGSLIGDAIRKAIESMGPRGDRDQVMVLITDGEDHDSYPMEAAKQAAERGIKIFTVGLGDSDEGRRVPVRDKTDNLTYLQHDGREVWSKMDEKLLKDIAVSTSGAYVPAKTFAYDLGEIYSQHLQKLTRGELASEKRKRYGERYQLFVVAGLILLLLDTLVPRFPPDKQRKEKMRGDAEDVQGSKGNARPVEQLVAMSANKHTGAFGLPLNEKHTGAFGLPLNEKNAPFLLTASRRRLRWTASASNLHRGLTFSSVLLALFLFAPEAYADAAREIRTGVASHQAGQFEQAEKSFAEAAKELPNHPVVLYDRACALAALGKLDDAESLFQQSKSADDPRIISDSHYNLGCLDTARAKAKFGDKPEEATADVRDEGMKLLEQAVMHYRDCLQLDREHAAARHNLEVIRMWMKHMTDVWRQRDRDKARQELGLLEFLLMIEQRQTELLQTTEVLAGEPASPRRRQAATAASQAQRELSEEIIPLQEKIQAALKPVQPAGTTVQTLQPAAPIDPRLEEVINQLLERTRQTRADMSQAAIELTTNNLQNAAEHQLKALNALDELYRAVAPFEHVLQRSIQVEEAQIESTRPLATEKPASQPSVPATPNQDLVTTQQQVTRWIETLGPKASAQLKDLESRVDQTAATEKTTDAANPAAAGGEPNMAALKSFYEKGIELGPQAGQVASDAVDTLQKKEWPLAVEKEEEVVRLLKQIAEAAPKNPQDENKQPEEEEKPEDQKKQDQKSDESENKKQQDEQQKKQDEQKNDEQKKDEQKKDKSQQQDSQQQSGQDKSKSTQPEDQQSEKRPNPSREMAEVLLRRVRQREREHKEREKELRAIIGGAVPVDKDW